MPVPPRPKPKTCRVHAFFDGQSLFKAAERAFGHRWPNFDPFKLAEAVTKGEPDRLLEKVHFYTGVHEASEDPHWYGFWTNKLNALQRHGAHIVRRNLRYSQQPVEISPGKFAMRRIGREKGIDLCLALDLVRLARRREYDVAVIFSQDQDLAEAVREVKDISVEVGHWIRVECAFPDSASVSNHRGVNGTHWRQIDEATYNACLDPTDYRPKRTGP